MRARTHRGPRLNGRLSPLSVSWRAPRTVVLGRVVGMDSARAPRKDAAENRERLLDVAEVYFSSGVDASLHGLARAAGVGIGTLYRHFATHEELVRALHERLIQRFAVVEEAVRSAPDPWTKLEVYLDNVVEVMTKSPSAAAVLERMRNLDPHSRPAERFRDPIQEMVDDAHADGTLRADVTAVDIGFVPYLLASLLRFPEPQRSLIVPRLRTVVLDGLRADGARSPLSTPALTAHALDEAAHAQRPPALPTL